MSRLGRCTIRAICTRMRNRRRIVFRTSCASALRLGVPLDLGSIPCRVCLIGVLGKRPSSIHSSAIYT